MGIALCAEDGLWSAAGKPIAANKPYR